MFPPENVSSVGKETEKLPLSQFLLQFPLEVLLLLQVIHTTLTTLATLCPSTPHLEKTSLQPPSLEGNPTETTLSGNIGQLRSTRQVKKSANAVHIQNFITTERWTLEARAAALRNAEMQLISHRENVDSWKMKNLHRRMKVKVIVKKKRIDAPSNKIKTQSNIEVRYFK